MAKQAGRRRDERGPAAAAREPAGRCRATAARRRWRGGGWASLALAGWSAFGCGGSAAPAASAADQPLAVSDPYTGAAASSAEAPFAAPVNIAPSRWLVLGPFAQAGAARETVLDQDYLVPLGGEATVQLAPATTIDVGGQVLSVRELSADDESVVDLEAAYEKDTDNRVAYAYGEVEWPREELVQASFGSDDGAAVWFNGQRVHRLVTPARGLDPNSDRFDVALKAGKNRILIKVENGRGGWGFALNLRDREGQERARRLEERRHIEALELRPDSGDYRLGSDFPRLVWGRAEAAKLVFGEQPLLVRWFDPDLKEVDRPEKSGRYVAVVAQKTRDGYTHREMLGFAKLDTARSPLPAELRGPPYAEPEPLRAEFFPGLSAAQQSELSRHVWRAINEYLEGSPAGASAQNGLIELATRPAPAGEPGWLSSSFIRDAEHQLALRLQLEGRTPRRLEPPAALSPRAPELRVGGEREAGIAPGTVQRLRGAAQAWLKEDPNGFVVMLARRGVIFMHEGFGGFQKEQGFRPASIGKLIAGLTFARAVDQGLVGFDDPVSSVFPEWKTERTGAVTFRHCFNHIAGLPAHVSHAGLYNAFLDNAFLVQDSAFVEPLRRHRYNGDSYNLSGKALELVTGQSMWRLLYENLQKPFGEPVAQFDLGFGDRFTARYLAKVGQMLLQDGVYGGQRFYSPGFLARLRPERVAAHAPGFPDQKLEWGIGQVWTPDPSSGPREAGALGPNVFGHGAASGSIFRVDPDHQLVVVIGRNAHESWGENERLAATFIETLAEGLREPKPAERPLPVASAPGG